jgi:hypothetical protein
MMVHLGLADGMVSGAAHTTAHTIRPAFEIIKTRPGVSVVSSVFLMALADRVLVYGDCAVIPDPTAEQLADIAISSAATARSSASSRASRCCRTRPGSRAGADVDKVRGDGARPRARARAARRRPDPVRRGGRRRRRKAKMPGFAVAGRATVFVFPDLNTGNNTYKAVQRSAGAVAMGPVLQGLNKPINDLSRGALVDIVNTIAITAIQARTSSRDATHDRRPRHQQRLLVVQVPARRRRVPGRRSRPVSSSASASGSGARRAQGGDDVTRANCRSPTTRPASRVMLEAFEEYGPSRRDPPRRRWGTASCRAGALLRADADRRPLVEINIDELSVLAPCTTRGALQGIRAARAAFPACRTSPSSTRRSTRPAAGGLHLRDRQTIARAPHPPLRLPRHEPQVRQRGPPLPRSAAGELKQIVLHLGNGASITAIDGGHSVDTSMGLTPLKASSWARARATSTRRCCSCSRRART